ncbi:MAG: hypothetical protein ACFHWX_03345 [Bacteroidota bacterium]
MKIIYWRILVGVVIVIALISFLFVFQTEITTPRLGSVPYIFWSSFLLTVLLVVLTYIGSKIFPYKDEQL